MRNILLIIAIVLFFLPSNLWADAVQLKDGRIIKGAVVEQNNKYVVIREESGAIKRFYKEQVENVVMGELVTPITVDLTQFENVSQQKAELIVRLIEASGIRSSMEKNINNTIKGAPASRKKVLEDLFDINEIVKELIPVYNKYFGEDDLLVLIEFYESPTGQKMLEVSPDLIKDVTQANIGYFQKKLTPQN